MGTGSGGAVAVATAPSGGMEERFVPAACR